MLHLDLETATQLRTAKATLKKIQRDLDDAIRQRDGFHARATKAEGELVQWRERFDVLLHSLERMRLGNDVGTEVNGGDNARS